MFAADDPISWTSAASLAIGVSAVMGLAGWLVIWIANRTADGRLGPNAWAGVRTSATRSSEAAWLVAHRAAHRPTVQGGQAGIVSAVLAIPIGLLVGNGDAERAIIGWGIVMGVGTVVLTVLVIYGAGKGHRAAKELAATGATDH